LHCSIHAGKRSGQHPAPQIASVNLCSIDWDPSSLVDLFQTGKASVDDWIARALGYQDG